MKLPEDIAPGNLPTHVLNFLRATARKVNGLASGSYRDKEGQATAAPTTGTWTQGDMVWNSNPVEAGSASSKYVTLGWICTVSGTPGTWLPVRTLTGN